ncbi:LAO/AO transport system kinase [Tepiditoga spiralis]|uniref:LAO/AO transport system kinase n=1 Tax=Tepiditoga spiralis TaxID=2108365 RepID=A0A7G1G3W6_9BACT|nr:methylmalonyl Co-A mutase-associated GTPase MeaB [Tepiditoga spiralis]BBE31148.1 LAO/AO transport system kinase [Tepiditoga spiralis]
MSWENKFNSIIEKFKSGEIYALAKMVSLVEDNPDYAWEIISKLPKKEHKQIIGITGSPGAGKSTLTSKLVEKLAKKGEKIGVIAVDPSSSFSGGAFLGDRIRMRNITKSQNVYIRSVASRGSVGGLCDSIFDIVDVMESFGFDKIIIETVGAGQTEIEIVFVADTILLVMSPDSGDEIQMFKAGIMEIADGYVVNKTDLPEANGFMTQLKNTLMLEVESKSTRRVFGTSSVLNMGIEDIVSWFDEHYNSLINTGELNDRQIRRNKRRIRSNLLRILDKVVYNYDGKIEDLEFAKEKILRELCKEENNYEK